MSAPVFSVVLAGGGTAGHIEPALNVADEFMRRYPGTRITALGTEEGLETRLVPERGYDLRLIPKVPLPRRPSGDLVTLPVRLRRAKQQCQQIFTEVQADVVIGFGGYVALPAYLAARRKLPIVIHEANARPGLANRVGARFASVVTHAGTTRGIEQAQRVGMPIRPTLALLDRAALRAEAATHFGLDPSVPTLFTFGGSLGARHLNDVVAAVVEETAARGAQVLQVLGEKNLDQTPTIAENLAGRVVTLPYLDRMELGYAVADLALTRGGAMTVAELGAVGLPAVIVPLPIGNGEQALNARELVDAGAAELIPDQDFTPERFREQVLPLLLDQEKLSRMSLATEGVSSREAAGALVEHAVQAVEQYSTDREEKEKS